MKTIEQNHTPQIPAFGGGARQTTHTILMIEPVDFRFNDQTAVNNYFQQKVNVLDVDIQRFALEEFNNMVEILRAKNVNVLVVKDTFEPHTPDSIFPNNWVSFHEGGQMVMYPMFAENRRNERRIEIFQLIEDQGVTINNVDDFTFWEEQNLFLEGTGSMVFDRVNKIAFAALSDRTDKSVFLQFCKVFDYKPVYYSANQLVNGKRLPVYHTNIMLSIANKFAVACLESIDNKAERDTVIRNIELSGKEIISITEDQMHCFAGNMIQIENRSGVPYLVLSKLAYDSLNKTQIEKLMSYNDLIIVSIPTIEKVGGGSVRCMMAEIFQ
jgi:hypothetical protein